MNLNFNIPEEHGEVLDTLAKEGHRSRRAQARKLIIDVIDMIRSNEIHRPDKEPAQMEAGQ